MNKIFTSIKNLFTKIINSILGYKLISIKKAKNENLATLIEFIQKYTFVDFSHYLLETKQTLINVLERHDNDHDGYVSIKELSKIIK